MLLNKLIEEINLNKNPKKAKILQRFFKTGKGQYGEGDIFLGITVPIQRKIAQKYYKEITLIELQKIIENKIHEFRMIALLILILKYEKEKDEKIKKEYFDFYLKNTKYINNWDLVDLSAPNIIGDYIIKRDRNVLYKLSLSKNLWEKRISIISTFSFIKNKEYQDTLKISETLLKDENDLIHKAVGWMLREVGKRIGEEYEEIFLKKHYKTMPRTMLRYSIERFDASKKEFYMKK